jgi:hypothetical protein
MVVAKRSPFRRDRGGVVMKKHLNKLALYPIAAVYLVGAVIAPIAWDLARKWWKS